MFPMIWAAIFLVSVERSWKALWTIGMISAKDGASMKWTNLVSSRVCRHFWVFLEGSVRASNRTGAIAEHFKKGKKRLYSYIKQNHVSGWAGVLSRDTVDPSKGARRRRTGATLLASAVNMDRRIQKALKQTAAVKLSGHFSKRSFISIEAWI